MPRSARIILLTVLSTCLVDGSRRAAADPPGAGTCLIVHAASLEPAATAWAGYRREQGWTVALEAVAPIPRGPDLEARRTARRLDVARRIRGHLEAHPRREAPAALAVLLLGDAGDGGVPTWRFDQRDPDLAGGRDPRQRHFVSDHPYQCLDERDDRPRAALGRVPARTVEEALTVLDKVRRYESAPPGAWRRRVSYAAGEGHYGAVDLLLEQMFRLMVERLVPDAYDLSLTYAKATSAFCPPPPRLTDTVLDRLGEGALLFNYIGHGWAHGFDRLRLGDRHLPILCTGDVARLDHGADHLPIALLTCCSAGWFDLEGGERSLAEAMLLNPSGPIAVIAGSRPTHPYANAVLQKDVTRLLLSERVATVGELDRLAAHDMMTIDRMDRELDLLVTPVALAGGWKTSLRGLRRMHVRLYNLLGDPALRIAHPAAGIESRLDGRRLSGRAPGVREGRLTITLETEKTSFARPGAVRPVLDQDDPDLVEKATLNYGLVNDRVLGRLEAEVRDERFAIDLPDPLPPGTRIVKLYAEGTGPDGRQTDAFGAVRVGKPGS